MSLFHADCWDCGDLATCTSIHDNAYLCDNCFVGELSVPGGFEGSERPIIGYLDPSESDSEESEDDLINDPTWFPTSEDDYD